MKLIVTSSDELSELIGTLRQLWKDKPYLDVTILQEKSRSLSLNAVLHRWCTQIAREEREYTDEHIKCLAKYHIFMPIQRGEDQKYSDQCEMVLKYLSYEEKLKAMIHWPVTRLMKSKPMLRGMENMQAHYVGRVELEFGEPVKTP